MVCAMHMQYIVYATFMLMLLKFNVIRFISVHHSSARVRLFLDAYTFYALVE